MSESLNHASPDLPEPGPTPIEHLVTHQDEGGQVIVVGLDVDCRPVYTTALFDYS
jgi:hypothetical protein